MLNKEQLEEFDDLELAMMNGDDLSDYAYQRHRDLLAKIEKVKP